MRNKFFLKKSINVIFKNVKPMTYSAKYKIFFKQIFKFM